MANVNITAPIATATAEAIAPTVTAEPTEIWDNQEFGTDIVGKLYSDGSLHLEGSGAMLDFAWNGSPVYNDSRVGSLVVESGITTIGENSFYNCSNLSTVDIPTTITTIKRAAFRNCGVNEFIASHEFSFGAEAFRNNPFTTGVQINVNLTSATSVGSFGPFKDCGLADRVTIGSSVTSIPDDIFGDAGITDITFPEALLSIGGYAFWDHLLTELTIPKNVSSIGEYAFGLGFSNDGLVKTVYNHHEGNQTLGTGAFGGIGDDVVGDKDAYCYGANTNFVTAIEAEGYTVTYYDDLTAPTATAEAEAIAPTITATGASENVNITAPTATATAAAIAPAQITIPVTGVSVYPTSATIDENELLIVTATVEPENASNQNVNWSSGNTNIATVDSNGIVTGIAEGSTTITATTADGGYTASCSLTVEEYIPVEYTALKILENDLTTVVHTIDNTEIAELTIEKELGGNVGLSFAMPYTAEAVQYITAGRYIECEE